MGTFASYSAFSNDSNVVRGIVQELDPSSRIDRFAVLAGYATRAAYDVDGWTATALMALLGAKAGALFLARHWLEVLLVGGAATAAAAAVYSQ